VRFYRWADGVGVAELSRLARTVRAWEAEILAWHTTEGCSNGPTEAVNLLIKQGPGKVAIRPYLSDGPHVVARRHATASVQAGSQIPATGIVGHSVQTATLPGPCPMR